MVTRARSERRWRLAFLRRGTACTVRRPEGHRWPIVPALDLLSIARARVLGPLLAPFRAGAVVMFHTGRCGSTVLADMLGQHRGVLWEGELYQRFFHIWARQGKRVDPLRFHVDPVELLRRRQSRSGLRYYGLEVKFFHLRIAGYELETFVAALDPLGFRHFVSLERRNQLRAIVSSLVGGEVGYHRRGAAPATLHRVTLDPARVAIDRETRPLLAYLEDYEERFAALRRVLPPRATLHLVYEDDIRDDPRVAYRRLCEFLALEAKAPTINYDRTNPFALEEMLANFDEVAAALRDTRFEWMLHG